MSERSESSRRESSRAEKAVCLFCRQRKIKCDRRKPDCTNCAKNGMQCVYVTEQKKPGLRAGYVSALERRLASVEQQIKELQAERQPDSSTVSIQVATGQNLETPSCPNGNSHAELSRCEKLLADSPISSLASRSDLCRQWFEKYHPWFPILHQISFIEELSKPCLFCSPQLVVFKTIVAVIGSTFSVPEFKHAFASKYDELLREEIILEAVDNISLKSLQALLILTIMDYGEGKFSSVWNLIALCKRVSTQLGLRDLVANKGDNFNQPSTIPPRILPVPSTLIEREERIRAYWITEALDSSSTIGGAWNLGVLKPENIEWLPCRDDIWTSPESIDVNSLEDADFSATFSLYVALVCNEIYYVHHFLQTAFDLTQESERERWRAEAMAVEQRLQTWKTQHWKQDFLTSPGGTRRTLFVAISVLIACTFQVAKIGVYQRLAYPTAAQSDGLVISWPRAVQCCLEACRSIAHDIRGLNRTGLESISPQVPFAIFVAARFVLLHGKRTASELDPVLHDFLYALMVCGRRWACAARLDTVLRAALDEFEGKQWKTPLPLQFWDPQYLTLDVDEELRVWAMKQEDTVRSQSSFQF